MKLLGTASTALITVCIASLSSISESFRSIPASPQSVFPQRTLDTSFSFLSSSHHKSANFLSKSHDSILRKSLILYANSSQNDGSKNKHSAFAITKNIVSRLADTMTPAGFESDKNNLLDNKSIPLASFIFGNYSGKRVFFTLAFLLFFRWYRAKFILKQKFTDRMPSWGHIITMKDQEEVLHAWTCKECGTTMFIAMGREFRFFNRWVECYNCGAKGQENFFDRRADVVAKNDDKDYKYENPMEYLTEKERKKVQKQMAKEGATEVEIIQKMAAEEGGTVVAEAPPMVTSEEEEEVEEFGAPKIEEDVEIIQSMTTEESGTTTAEAEAPPMITEKEKEVEVNPTIEEDISMSHDKPAPKISSVKPAAPAKVKPPVIDDLDILGMDM